MNENHLNYLKENRFDPNDYVVLNPFVTKLAKKKDGSAMCVIEIEEPKWVELIGPGCSVAFKKWCKANGILEAHEAQSNELAPKPPVFAEKVEQVKKVITPATPAEAFEIPPPPTGAPVETAEKPIEDYGFDLTTMQGRTQYLHKLGFEHFSDHKGYLNNGGNRWVDEKVVSTLDDPKAYVDYVAKQSEIPWKPENVAKFEEAPSIVPKETETKKLTLAEEEALKNERIKLLTDNGYIQDAQTYKYEKDGHIVSMSQIQNYSDQPWSIEKHIKLVEKVPEAIKEIARESDNVIIASTGSPAPKESPMEALLSKRVKELMDIGWEMDFEKSVLKAFDSSLVITEKEIMDVPSDDWDLFVQKKTTVFNNIKMKAEERAKEKANHTAEEVKAGLESEMTTTEKEVGAVAETESLEDTSTGLKDENGKEVHLVAKDEVSKSETIVEENDTDVRKIETKEPVKIYTETELKEMKTADVRAIVDKLKIEVPEEGANTNKKYRTLILGHQKPIAEKMAKEKEEARKAEKLAKEKAEKAPLENVVTANDDLAVQFDVIDKIIDGLHLFKKTYYSLERIKAAMEMNVPDESTVNRIQDILDELES